MNRILWLLCLTNILLVQNISASNLLMDEPDSVYLFSYATNKNGNHNGLHFAWSTDNKNWLTIGKEYGFVKSDYGPWGSDKKMISPYVIQDLKGEWHCIWSLNETDKVFAHAASANLIDWGRQTYPEQKEGANCLRPVLQFDRPSGDYIITYTDSTGKFFRVKTKDFKSYSSAQKASSKDYLNLSKTVTLSSGNAMGQVHRVPWKVVKNLINTYEQKQYKNIQNEELAQQDGQRFAGLKPVDATITIQSEKAKPISDMLLGIFFEDINYAADGGLYAELIQNRDFEYTFSDRNGRDKSWNSTHSWSLKGDNTIFTIDSLTPLHANNPHYAVLNTKAPGATLVNAGFDGIAMKKGEKYKFSLYAKQVEGRNSQILVRIVNKKREMLAETTLNVPAGGWKLVKAIFTSMANAEDASLELQPLTPGVVALDMISLFPNNTFKGRENGLRTDLAQTIADMHPRFVRFPGGCVAHGNGLNNIYHWKNTIGPLEARKPQPNLWGYHQTAGLGYFEYFRFCEDIGAAPLPVVAAGVPCQNSGVGGKGQQGGIPMNEMDEYVQDIIDLVEYANGDVTTTWGKKRAEAGHPKPFNLKYIGVGNEDLITDIFEERFTMIYNALKKTHPEITVIGTVGPFFEGTDYREGWDIAEKLSVPMVDEHYYQSPGWFINNQDFYDKYDRSKPKVYLGEYAASIPRGITNHETALAEALYLTSLERNGDVVSMTSYAPLLAKEGHTQWNPDLIYFNNTTVKPTSGYYVQQLYGRNAGNEYLPGTLSLSNDQESVKKRIAYSVVRDSKTKDLIVKMVNLLPVVVNSTIDLKDIKLSSTKAVKTVLQGKPEDKNTMPIVSECSVSEKFTAGLPAYSLTVIRIKTR